MKLTEEVKNSNKAAMGREPRPLYMLKSGECKYALGNWSSNVIGGYLFCGASCPAQASYCEAHQKDVWISRKPAA